MADAGHIETDKKLAELEKKISREYSQAVKETWEKLDDYFKRFEMKDKKWLEWVESGEKTLDEYKEWRKGQMIMGQRWIDMRETLAQDYHNANILARSMIQGYMPEVYAINHNYATYLVESGARVDTLYTLYDRQTVERLIRDDPDLLPAPGKKMKKALKANPDIAWQAGQIQSVTLQAILQGESIPNMAKRIAQTMGETNHKSTIRYARTAITGAENAGRQAGYERARDMGIELRRTWVAVLDSRTRHEHRILDGQTVDIDEPFEVDGMEIMYPGDPSADASLIWNCRCTLISQIKGFEHDLSDLGLRRAEGLDGMTYEEWKEAHAESRPITSQEETGRRMANAYASEYRRRSR